VIFILPGRRCCLSGNTVYASLLITVLIAGYQILNLGLLVSTGNIGSSDIQPAGEIPVINVLMSEEDELSASQKEKENVNKRSQENTVNNSRGAPGMVISQEELDLLARVIYAEARGEDLEGQVAVGAVVLNRLKDPQFPKTIKEVIYQRGAFTAVDDKQIHLLPNEKAYQAAKEAIKGQDPTGGALYYYNPRTAKDKWIKGRPVIKQIGNHNFSI
jgi:spore germination cell wall hydrolase CwlJ-like protein